VSSDIPHVMHYGLIYKVGDREYDKHWYFDFDVHKCTPWPGLEGKPKAGIFPPPPHPDKLPKKVRQLCLQQCCDLRAHYLDSSRHIPAYALLLSGCCWWLTLGPVAASAHTILLA
jgi:hypothetical protein